MQLSLAGFNAVPKVSGLLLSPRGDRLVMQVQTLVQGGSRFASFLWEMPADGSAAARRMTQSTGGESNAAFLPDGSLVFTSAEPSIDQERNESRVLINMLRPESSDVRQLLFVPGAIEALATARSANTIVVRVTMFPSAADLEADAAIGQARLAAGANGILFEELETRHQDHEIGPRLPRLLMFDVDPEVHAAPVDLTPDAGGALVASQFAVCPDGTGVVTRWRRPIPLGFREIELRLLARDGARVIAQDAQFSRPAVSPDGRWVVAERLSPGSRERSERISLWLIDLQSGAGEELTQNLDLWPDSPIWAPDSGSVYFVADKRGRVPIFRVDIRSREVDLIAADGSYDSICPAPDGETLFAIRYTYAGVPKVVKLSIPKRARSMVTSPGTVSDATPDLVEMNAPGTSTKVGGRIEEVVSRAEDGTEIHGWLAMPDSASRENPAPLVLWIHGGIRGWSALNFWQWCPQLFTERGYAVLMANPARSTGYGQAFIQRAWGDWRERVIGDLLAAVNGVATRPDIDGERVAAMGHSFGAHICNWLAGMPEHFKAVVSASGLWAFDQFHATTDKSTMWEEEFGDPYLDVEPYIRNSPRVQLDAIRVPMLVIHGLRDYQVPVSEAIRLWTDIKRHDVPGKFLLLPDENHSLTLKPADVNLVYQTSLAFLDHHVLGQPWVRPEILG